MNKKEALAKIEELKKYIEELEKQTYSIGDKFRLCEEEYIIARFDDNKICLICLENGNRWRNPVEANEHSEITEEEFEAVTLGYPFTKI